MSLPENHFDTSSLSIQEAARILKVSEKTLRRWEERGILEPLRTHGGHRRYSYLQLQEFKKHKKAIERGLYTAPVSTSVPYGESAPTPSLVAATTTPVVSESLVETSTISHSVSSHKQISLRLPTFHLPTVSIPTLSFGGLQPALVTVCCIALLALSTLMITSTPSVDFAKLKTVALGFQLPRLQAPRFLVLGKKQPESVNTSSIILGSTALEYTRFSLNVDTILNENLLVAKDATISGSLTLESGQLFTSATSASIFPSIAQVITIGSATSTTTVGGDLTITGNSLSTPGDLVIDPGGGAVLIGDSTPGSIDSAAGDLFVSGDIELDGTLYGPNAQLTTATIGTLSLNGDAFTDLTGTGLLISNGSLQTSLGTSIASSELEDGSIAAVDLKVTGTPGNGSLLSYDSASGGFSWGDGASLNLFTDGGDVTYLTATTDDLTVGSALDLAKLGIDGDSDEIQFLIQGNSTQTANYFVVEASDGTDLLTINSTGSLNLTAGQDLSIGGVGLNDIGSSNTTSGAALIGVFDEFNNSNATTLQDILDDFDSAMGSGASKWTDSGTLTYLTATADDVAIGGSTLASSFSVNVASNLVRIGTGATADATLSLYSANGDTGSLSYNTSDQFVFSNGNVLISGLLSAGSTPVTLTTATGYLDADALQLITADGAGSTGSASGLEVDTDRIGLLQGCADGQVLKWNDATNLWECGTDTGASFAVVNVENNDVAIGTNVDSLDFNTEFSLVASPSNEANISIANNAVDLGTQTVGNYVAALTEGTAIDISGAAGEGWSPTVTFDSTELGTTTFGSGSGIVWTFDVGATDPTLTFASDALTIAAGSTGITGNLDVSGTFTSGTANAFQVDASGNLNTTGTLTAATNETINGIDINTGTVSDVVNLTINAGGDLTIGAIGLNDVGTDNITSGASLVGVFDEFGNSASTTVQDVLDDLDAAITAGAAGDISSVTAGSGLTGGGASGDVTLDIGAGTGISVVADSIALDFSAALSGDHTLAANESKFGVSGLIFEGATANTIETYVAVTDPTGSDKTITLPDLSGTVILSGHTFTGDVSATLGAANTTALTIAADSIALGTDTTGNYVAALTEGTAIDISGTAGEAWSPTVTFDSTELGTTTFGSGSGIVWTFDVGATDPTLTFASDALTIAAGATAITGNLDVSGTFTSGTANAFQVDASGNVNTTGTLTAATNETINGIDINTGTVSDVVNLTINAGGDLTIGAIGLNDVGTDNITSGASLVGVFDEFGNSASTTVQDVLDDLDAAITAGAAGDISSVTAGSGLTGGGASGDVILDIGAGTGISVVADSIALDFSAALSGDHTLAANESKFGVSGLIFEGATANAIETYFAIADATVSDKTITFPDLTGTVLLSGHTFTGDVTATLGAANTTALTIASDAVALGTDTTGNYVSNVTGTNGISVSGTAGEGWTAALELASSTAGNGLTFTTGVLDVGAGNGISVAANSVSVDQAYAFVWTNDHSFQQADPTIYFNDTTSSAKDFYISVDADNFVIANNTDGRNDILIEGTGRINIGDNTTGKTIDIAGVNSSAADTVNIATNSTAADVITIGNNNAATTLALTGGDDWSISTAGAIVTTSTISAATDETINGIDISTGTVTDVVNLTINGGGDLTIGTIGLNDVGSDNITSGASLVGVYDEFTNSSSTTVQDVLDDLDAAIAGAGGDITSVVAGSGLTGGGVSGDVTLDIGAGTGISVVADSIALDFSAALSGDHTLAANESKFGVSGLIFEGATANTIETYLAVTDPTSSDKTITLPDLSGTIILSGHTFTGDVTATLGASNTTALTIAADSVALGSDTTGNFVASLTEGTAIDISGTAGEAWSPTVTFDSTELGTTTFGSGSGITWTFDVGATDPTLAFASDALTITAGSTGISGNLDVSGTFTSGTANAFQVDSSGNLNTTGTLTAATNETINGIDINTGTVSDVVNLTINAGGDLTIGAIGLNDVGTTNITSGASLVGVFDEFTNSSSTTVQDVLDDLDAAIAGAGGDITSVVAGAGLSGGGVSGDVTLDIGSGTGISVVADSIALDFSAALSGDHTLAANESKFAQSGLIFEGATANTIETYFSIADATSADKTITFPDLTGTVLLSGHTFTGDVTATLGASNTTALTIASDSVALGTDTTGNFVASLTEGTAIDISGTAGEAWSPTVTFDSTELGTTTFGSGSGVVWTFDVGATDPTLTFASDALTIAATSTGITGNLDVSGTLASGTANAFQVDGSGNILTSGTLTVSGGSATFGSNGTDGSIVVYNELGATDYSVTLQPSGSQTGSYSLTLPVDDGTSNYVLTTDGAGVLSWQSVTGIGAGSGDINTVGSMTSGDVFADANADDDWLGLGASAGRIEFDDQATDEVNIMAANVGIGTQAPSSALHVAGASGITIGTDIGSGSSNIPGKLALISNGDNAYSTIFQTGTQTQDVTYTLPNDDGSSNQVLITDGAGILDWVDVTGIGGTGDITSVVAGSGLTGGGTSGDVTLDIGAGTAIDINADDIAWDSTEVGTTTYGSGSGFTWTFDAGATDPTIAAASDSLTLTAGTITTAGTLALGSNNLTVTGGTLSTAELLLLDGRSGTLVDSNNVATYATTGVTAGSGLTGGGTVGALTLNIGAGTGIAVNANDIAFDFTAALSGDHTLSANNAIFGQSGLIFEGATANTIETYFSIADATTTDKTITFPDLSGTVLLSGHTFTGDVTATLGASNTTALTIASDSVALGTDTTGNFVAGLTEGTAIDISGTAGEAWSPTVTFDSTELGTTTFGSGSGVTWTFDVGATDPTLTFASDALTITAGATGITGNVDVSGTFTSGTANAFQVDASGNLNTTGTLTAATNETINGIDITTGTVSDVVNLTINAGGDLTIGAIGLNDVGTDNITSGASLVGTFDEFTNSASTTVQDVLDDLDAAITTASAGDISSVTAGSGLTGGGVSGDVTLDIGAGTGISVAADAIAFDFTAALSGDHTLSANESKFGQSGLIFEGATANTIETYFAITDPTASDKTITFPDLTGTVLLSGHTFTGDVTATLGASNTTALTIASDSVALGTDTTGNYVAGLTEGTAIDISGSAGEGWSPTVTFDSTELGTTTFGSGSGVTWTFDVGATDPTLAFASDALTITAGSTGITGNLDVSGTFTSGTANAFQVDSSGNLNTTGTLTAATNETVNGIDINTGTVSDVVNLTINAGGDLTIGAIGLNDVGTDNITSGASLVGVFDEFGNSASTTVQDVLDDLDAAITAGAAGDISSVTAGSGLTGGGASGDVTLDIGAGTGISVVADSIALDFSAALSGDHTLAANESKFGVSGLIFEGATANTIETYFAVTDPTASDKTITFPDLTGTVLLSGHTFTGDVTATLGASNTTALTIASDSVALGTDTTGNFVAGLTEGTAIDISGTAGEAWSPTVTFDSTELGTTTFGSGSGIVWTFDVGATDPTLTFASDALTLTAATTSFSGDLDLADDNWIGLASGAGLIEFDDQTTDEVNILNANVGIGSASPTYKLQVDSGNISEAASFTSGSSANNGNATVVVNQNGYDSGIKTTVNTGSGTRNANIYGLTTGVTTSALGNVGANDFEYGSGNFTITHSGAPTTAKNVYGVKSVATANDADFTVYGGYFSGASTNGTAYGVYSAAGKNYFNNIVGIGTTAPDKMLEINSATGANLRLTYNDNNGSATNYSDFSTTSGGDLTIAPSGSDVAITGNVDVSGTLTSGTADAFQVDASGNVNTTGTLTAATAETINGVDINTGTITDVVNLTINTGGDLTIGAIGLNDVGTDNITSGASLVGAFDEFGNSASTTVQDVLDDLDAAITTASAGDISSVVAGSGLTGGGTSGDVTLDIGAGTGISVVADSIALDFSAALSGDHTLAANESKFGVSGLIFEGATANTIETYFAVTDPTASDKTITFPDLSGTVLLSGHTFTGDVTATLGASNTTALTIASDSVALGTDTTGNYVAGLTEGTAIDISGSAGEGWSPTVTFDSTELGTTTFGSGSGIVWTFDAGATDPSLTFGSDALTLTAATTTISGDIDMADDNWIGLSSGAGLIEFDDQTTDEVNILNANVGIGTQTPGGKLAVVPGTNQSGVVVSGYSIDSSLGSGNNVPLLDLSGTWNTASTASGYSQTGIRLNITNTQTGSSSFLMDLQTGGTSRFSVSPTGISTAASSSLASDFRVGTSTSNFSTYYGTYTALGSAGYMGFASVNGTDPRATLDTILYRDAAGSLALRNSTNAQTFNIYNTYTDASNFERLSLGFTGNVATLNSNASGTGTARNFNLTGGNVGVNTTGADAKLDVLSTTEQLRLTYTDGSVYSSFTVDSAGDLTIAPSGSDLAITGNVDASGTLTAGTGNAFQVDATGAITAATAETINGIDINTGTVSDVVNLTINSGGDITIGAIGLNDVGTDNITSGASLVGVFDEFTNSASTTVQDVLDDLDAAIAGAGGDISSVVAGAGLTGGGVSGDVTLDVGAGTAIDINADDIAWDSTEVGTTTYGSGSGITWTFDAGATDPTIAFASDSMTLTAGSITAAGNLTVSGTTGLTLSGVGGDITFANGEKIDNDTDGTVTITAPTTAVSGDLSLGGGDITTAGGENIDLGEATADTSTFYINSTAELALNATNLTAGAAEGNSLGSASTEWEQLFLGDDNGIAFGLDQDWTIGYDETTDDRLELVTSGTSGMLIQSATATGTGLATTFNALSSGTGLALSSTSTALTTGGLASLDWSPGSLTTASGDLFRLNIGTNGTTTGNLFDIEDTGSSLFSVSETAITANLPTSFTAAGDVSMAYDLLFTNQTAAYIKSYGPLILQAGESFENNNLALQTYGTGNAVFDFQGTGDVVVNSADPNIIFDSKTATDTDFWLGVQEDAGSDDDDLFQIGDGTTPGTNAFLTINTSGNVGIGTTGPDGKLDVLATSGSQLRLTYADGSTYTDFTTNSSGDLTVAPSGSDLAITGNVDISGTLTSGTGNAFQVDASGAITAATAETINGIDISTGTVSDVVNLTINSGGDVTIGAIGLNDVGTDNITSGASLIGVFDEFTNSNATTVQDVLDDLDALITGGTGDITSVVAGAGLIDGGITGDVTLNVGEGTAIDINADDIAWDSTEVGTTTYGSGSGITWTFNAGATDPTIAFASDAMTLTAGSITAAGNLTVSGTTGLSLSGVGGDITFANAEKIDNDTDGTVTITAPITAHSGDISVAGGDITTAGGENIDLGEATADTSTFYINSVAELALSATNLTAGAAEGNSLGSATTEWEQLFLGDDNGIAFGLDQDWTFGYDETTDDRLELVTAGTTGMLIQSATATGTGMATTFNALSSGTGLSLTSTSTALTTGALANIDWSPGSATSATGDLFKINIGANGSTSGNLFNITDAGSSLFSVSEAAITANLPTNFTAAGDVSLAYDLQFTNQTASYIKSKAPLYIEAGESFESNDLTLRSYNAGDIIMDLQGTGFFQVINQSTAITGTTTTDLNVAGAYINSTDLDTISLLVRNSNTGAITMQNVGTAGAQGDPGVLTVEGAGSSTTAYNLITAYNSLTRSDAASVFRVRADGTVYGEAAFQTTGADLAEYFEKEGELPTNEVVGINYETGKVRRFQAGDKLLGVTSNRAGFVGNYPKGKTDDQIAANYALVGFTGQLDVKLDDTEGPIRPGDPLRPSTQTGRATKANKPGYIIGYALEAWTPGSGDRDVLTYVNPSFADPTMALDNQGQMVADGLAQLASNPDAEANKTLIRSIAASLSEIVETTNNVFSTLIAGNIQSSTIQTDTLTVGGKSLQNLVLDTIAENGFLIAKTDKIETREASISGILTAAEATISGNLTAKNITEMADRLISAEASISSLLSTEATMSAEERDSLLATLNPEIKLIVSDMLSDSDDWSTEASSSADVITADAVFASEYLNVQGTASITNANINNALIVGGSLAMDKNSINLISDTESTLYVQATGAGTLDFLAGALTLNREGGLVVTTDALFTQDVTVQGALSATTIAPETNILGIQLTATESSALATESGKLAIKSGVTEVASIDASGSATFAKLTLSTPETATGSASTASTGKAVLKKGQTDVIIYTTQVSEDSLIYITPTSSTNNQVLYVSGKQANDAVTVGGFTVTIDQTLTKDVEFNWWIIN